MGHYALIDQDNIVVQVFVGKDETDPLPEGIESWEKYYCPNWAKACLRTSYNTLGGQHPGGPEKAFRGNYAGVGFKYDEELDAFIPPQPWESWHLNKTTFLWEPPTPYPLDDKVYTWNELNKSWDEFIVPDSEPVQENAE